MANCDVSILVQYALRRKLPHRPAQNDILVIFWTGVEHLFIVFMSSVWLVTTIREGYPAKN